MEKGQAGEGRERDSKIEFLFHQKLSLMKSMRGKSGEGTGEEGRERDSVKVCECYM